MKCNLFSLEHKGFNNLSTSYVFLHLGYVQHSMFFLQVVYFTAIFPFVVLIILFFRGVTLENASEGMYYFIVPDFNRLLEAQVCHI